MSPDSEIQAPLPSPEGSPRVLVSVPTLVVQIADEMRTLTAKDSGKESTETYGEQARKFFLSVRDRWSTLVDAGQDKEAEPILEQMFAHFLEREGLPEGAGNFTLKNAHNAVVRDYDEPRFLKALLAHIIQKENELGAPDTPKEKRQLVMKAVEFDANRKRRTGFHLMKEIPEATDEDRKQGAALVDEANDTFQRVLGHWQQEGDLDSQSRVLYETAMIATELQNWVDAASAYAQSCAVAEQSGNKVGARIALISRDYSLREGKLEYVTTLMKRAREHTATMRQLAKAGDPVAESWVSSALFYQAEVAIDAIGIARKANSAPEAQNLQNEAVLCCDEIIADPDGYLAKLKENRDRLRERTQALKERALRA